MHCGDLYRVNSYAALGTFKEVSVNKDVTSGVEGHCDITAWSASDSSVKHYTLFHATHGSFAEEEEEEEEEKCLTSSRCDPLQ